MTDAVLIYGFGGPEAAEEVMPFLKRVTGGRVPEARLNAVAEHYHLFGGRSPINDQNRALVRAVEQELAARSHPWPVFFANRHSAPELQDVGQGLQAQGVKRVAVFVTSAYGSFSGCRAYRQEASEKLKGLSTPPELIYCQKLFDQHGFVVANAAHLEGVWNKSNATPGRSQLLFTAHSIPLAMDKTAPYQEQLQHTCAAVADAVGIDRWELVWQSRSGPPSVPWLEPDVSEAIALHHERGGEHVVVHPIGFLSDHMEVIYDLDLEAKQTAEKLGVRFDRVPTVGTHPAFVQTVVDSVEVALGRPPGPTVGDTTLTCKPGCCAYQPVFRTKAG